MKKIPPGASPLYAAIVLFPLMCGCLTSVSDPEADRAAAALAGLRRAVPEKAVGLKEALKMVPPTKYIAARRAFAGIAAAGDDPRTVILREKSRIELNCLLGYLPEVPVRYDPAGALDDPGEIPDVRTAEKAALIIDAGRTGEIELLRRVALAHADAVLAAESAAGQPSPENQLGYLLACLRLAEAVGVDLPELFRLREYGRRLDDASYRLEKSRKSRPEKQ